MYNPISFEQWYKVIFNKTLDGLSNKEMLEIWDRYKVDYAEFNELLENFGR